MKLATKLHTALVFVGGCIGMMFAIYYFVVIRRYSHMMMEDGEKPERNED